MQTIAVWFSCGAASAVAAKKTLELYKDTHLVRVVNNPVIEEDEDNIRFLHDVEDWLGVKIEYATNKNYPKCSAVDVWERRNFMSGPLGAPCTIELKKHARQQWEEIHKPDWHVLGFTAEERTRYERFIQTERENLLPVLIDANLTKQDCLDILGVGKPSSNDLAFLAMAKASIEVARQFNLTESQEVKVLERVYLASREALRCNTEMLAKHVYEQVKDMPLILSDEVIAKAKGGSQ